MKKVSEQQYQKFSSAMHNILKRLDSLNQDTNSIYPEGITNTELSVISFVKANPNAFIKEISQNLYIPGSTLTSVIDRLQRRGLIIRTLSERNRRSYSLTLTEEGMRISALHEGAEKKMWESVLGALDCEDDREKFIALLELASNGL